MLKDIQKLFDSFPSIKVGVIGDVMLDTYMWGKVDRISPEAPVPVVSLTKKEYRMGGAGNVALNCRSLGAQVFIFSVTGNDNDAALLEELLNENSIDTAGLVKSNTRITTNKMRIISRNQQMLRLDNETTADINGEEENLLLQKLQSFIAEYDPDIIILEDYNKGVLTEYVIENVIRLCGEAGVLTAVDPKRKNFFSYKNVTLFKPNLKEVKEALNIIADSASVQSLSNVHEELKMQLAHEISFITLSEKGVFVGQNGWHKIIPSHLRNIADVSGAGDTVIATAALVYAATQNIQLMAEMANIAGGLVCEEVGTVAIDKEKLMHECELLLS
jgi:rfaE bifunctional protein kinase chain/domain